MPETVPPYFDSLTLAAVTAEIRASVGARFAGVRQPSRDAIVLSLRDPDAIRHLLFSIHPHTSRVHFAPRPETTERLASFGQLLRSRLIEASLAGVEQPPFDRILRLRFDALEGPLVLIAEIMGRYSNLILTDGRVVVGALKVVTAQMSPRRPVLPGRPYVSPPADRPRPDTLDEAGLRALLEGDRRLAERLSGSLLGLSPLVSREIAARAGLDPTMPAGEAAASSRRIWTALREICAVREKDQWAPTIYLDDARIGAFAPFPMRVYDEMRPLPAASMSEAVDRYYQAAVNVGPLEERRRALATAVRAALQQREKALENNRKALAETRSAERLRVMGDLILTYGSRARPRDAALTVPDYTAEGAEITIPLDPALTPAENAQQYFRRYAKAQATARALPARIARLTSETLILREAVIQIEAATSADDLWEIHADLAALGALRRAPRSRPVAPTGPRRYRTEDGSTIVVGRSARENDDVTFHVAGPNDLWLHARGLPGAHVILKSAGDPAEASITAAAQVAAHYSEGRHAAQVAVDCVARKHVRKLRGAPPGAVVYEGERTLRVWPTLPVLAAEAAAVVRRAPRSRPRQRRRSR